MNAEKIAQRLSKLEHTENPEELSDLVMECEPRRQEIRNRGAEIAFGIPGVSVPIERERAIRKGPDAVKKLDDEADSLDREFGYLNSLEMQINEARERAIDRQAARALPIARARLPDAMDEVRSTLKKFRAAVSSLNSVLEDLGQYERLGKAFPFNDEDLAALLQLREDAWQVNLIRTLNVPGVAEDVKKLYPGSFDLIYESRGDPKYGYTFAIRSPQVSYTHLDR